MATKFAAREVLVLATEDDCSGWSNSENREGIDGAIGPGPCSFSTRRIYWVSEDELQEEDHLGKQSFILHW